MRSLIRSSFGVARIIGVLVLALISISACSKSKGGPGGTGPSPTPTAPVITVFDIRIDDGSSTGRSFSGEVPVGTNLLVYMSFNLNSPRDLTTSIDVTLDGSIVESITATGPVAEGITSAKRKFKTSHPGMYLANGTVEGLGRDEKSTSVLVVP